MPRATNATKQSDELATPYASGVDDGKTDDHLSAYDRVILFCVATATDYGTVGITAHTMQSMAIRGFIAHDS